ncbi:MAG: hypothetical protein AAF530_23870 [Pseudomonadota bacterium]
MGIHFKLALLLVATALINLMPVTAWSGASNEARVSYSADFTLLGLEATFRGTLLYSPDSGECQKSYRFDAIWHHPVTDEKIADMTFVLREAPKASWTLITSRPFDWSASNPKPLETKLRKFDYDPTDNAFFPIFDEHYDLARIDDEVLDGTVVGRYSFVRVGSGKNPFVGTAWVTQEGIPVRIVGSSKKKNGGPIPLIEFSNINIGSNHCSIFEAPADHSSQ